MKIISENILKSYVKSSCYIYLFDMYLYYVFFFCQINFCINTQIFKYPSCDIKYIISFYKNFTIKKILKLDIILKILDIDTIHSQFFLDYDILTF